MTLSDVAQLEERLRQAMLASDVAALDELISDRLRFVTLEGFTVGKAADLEAHRSGNLCLVTLTPGEPHVELLAGGEVALVDVAVQVAGRFAGAKFAGFFRYTRAWHHESGRPLIIAGQICAIHTDPR